MSTTRSQARPVVGIIACNRQTGGEASVAVMRRYVEATMRHADCAALVIPSLPDAMQAAEVVPRLDGLLLSGSPSNVEPARYGDASMSAGPFDPARDCMTAELIAAALSLEKPIFGICRGFQELNIAFGGTLRRDLGDRSPVPHHASEQSDLGIMFAHRHPVALTPGGRLAAAYNRPSLTVNSVHYQGVDRLGAGLSVEATADDGVVEAFSAPGILAVQWHPEWETDQDADSQTLFRAFGAMLRA